MRENEAFLHSGIAALERGGETANLGKAQSPYDKQVVE